MKKDDSETVFCRWNWLVSMKYSKNQVSVCTLMTCSSAEPISGFETAQIPPASRSPSPKPRRKAAKKAMKAIAATAATAQGSKMVGTSKMKVSSKEKQSFLK